MPLPLPLPLAPGTMRSRSVARSSRALVLLTLPSAVQFEPALVEYCQLPLALFAPVIAMPCTEP